MLPLVRYLARERRTRRIAHPLSDPRRGLFSRERRSTLPVSQRDLPTRGRRVLRPRVSRTRYTHRGSLQNDVRAAASRHLAKQHAVARKFSSNYSYLRASRDCSSREGFVDFYRVEGSVLRVTRRTYSRRESTVPRKNIIRANFYSQSQKSSPLGIRGVKLFTHYYYYYLYLYYYAISYFSK